MSARRRRAASPCNYGGDGGACGDCSPPGCTVRCGDCRAAAVGGARGQVSCLPTTKHGRMMKGSPGAPGNPNPGPHYPRRRPWPSNPCRSSAASGRRSQSPRSQSSRTTAREG